jgi:hypothetical protein
VKAAQEAWFEASPDLDPGRLVFPDEPAAATSIGLVEERPLLRAAFSEAVIPLSARLRHSGLPVGAEPDVRLGAHYGRSADFRASPETDAPKA